VARSITDICNVSLGMNGARRIADIAEDSENARLCNTFYRPSVEEVLCMYHWSRAKHTKVVTSDATYETDTFDYGYAYRFPFPANPYCLEVRSVNGNLYDWQPEGRFVYTDQETCEMVYTKLITDTNEFNPLLAEAISVQLAIRLSFPLKQTNRLRLELIEYLETVVLDRAKTVDAREGFIKDEKGKHSWRKAGGRA
jgi:hypothetical protein